MSTRMQVSFSAVMAGVAAVAALHSSQFPDASQFPDGDGEPRGGAARHALCQESSLAAAPAPGVTLWTVVDPSDYADLPPQPMMAEDLRLVRISADFGQLRTGDRLAIAIPQLERTYRPIIERIERGPAGSLSYLGTLAEHRGRQLAFVVTVGASSLFARLDTPEGTFDLAANKTLGWLTPAAGKASRADYSEPGRPVEAGGAAPWLAE